MWAEWLLWMVGVETLPSLIGCFYTAWMNASASAFAYERMCHSFSLWESSFYSPLLIRSMCSPISCKGRGKHSYSNNKSFSHRWDSKSSLSEAPLTIWLCQCLGHQKISAANSYNLLLILFFLLVMSERTIRWISRDTYLLILFLSWLSVFNQT